MGTAKLKVNDRVQWTDKDFLSNGYIKKIVQGIYIIKLDTKAPNEYAWETDEVVSFGGDIVKEVTDD